METTIEQLEDMERMMKNYKADMVKVNEEEAKMYADGEIGIPLPIDPNGPQDYAEFPDPEAPEDFIDDPEPEAHTKIILEGSEENIEKVLDDFKNEGIECIEVPEPELVRAEPGTFLHWLACQNERVDFIGDLSRIYIRDITYNNVSYTNYEELCDNLENYDDLTEILKLAKIEFDDFQEEEETYRDEQHMLKLQEKKKHVGC